MTRSRRHEQPSPEGRRPVREYRERELHQFLVEDAVRHHATDLPWAVAAYKRIGKLSGKGPEAAFLAVVADVESLTGMAMMPLTSLSEVQLRKLSQQ